MGWETAARNSQISTILMSGLIKANRHYFLCFKLHNLSTEKKINGKRLALSS
jgi:hypothetical protein